MLYAITVTFPFHQPHILERVGEELGKVESRLEAS